jgi:hypothetical protein
VEAVRRGAVPRRLCTCLVFDTKFEYLYTGTFHLNEQFRIC